MRRVFRLSLLLSLLTLSACLKLAGSTPPSVDLDNACAIVRDKPSYLRAMRKTEKRWGVPVAVQMAVIHQESSFVRNSRAPRKYLLGVIPAGRQSSSYGYTQAVDGTWNDYREATGKKYARRTSYKASSDFIGWYFANTKRRLGIGYRDVSNHYLAYHEGVGGYKKRSYLRKPWLMEVASKVEKRAFAYHKQLKACRAV